MSSGAERFTHIWVRRCPDPTLGGTDQGIAGGGRAECRDHLPQPAEIAGERLGQGDSRLARESMTPRRGQLGVGVGSNGGDEMRRAPGGVSPHGNTSHIKERGGQASLERPDRALANSYMRRRTSGSTML